VSKTVLECPPWHVPMWKFKSCLLAIPALGPPACSCTSQSALLNPDPEHVFCAAAELAKLITSVAVAIIDVAAITNVATANLVIVVLVFIRYPSNNNLVFIKVVTKTATSITQT
jgi:hypothetical protein